MTNAVAAFLSGSISPALDLICFWPFYAVTLTNQKGLFWLVGNAFSSTLDKKKPLAVLLFVQIFLMCSGV